MHVNGLRNKFFESDESVIASARACLRPQFDDRRVMPVLSSGQWAGQAPDTYRVRLETTKGNVVLELRRAWSPEGADRFYNLVKAGFFERVAFFRAIDGYMVQFGMSGEPSVQKA